MFYTLLSIVSILFLFFFFFASSACELFFVDFPCKDMSVGGAPSDGGGVVWCVTQHLSAGTGFPFLLQVEDAQVCVDYPAKHHRCCWTRAMLQPVWENFIACPVGRIDLKKEGSLAQEQYPQTDASSSSFFSLRTRRTLAEISQSVQLLFKRQQQQRPPCRHVNRLRYIHLLPSVVRVGRGIAGKLSLTFSLRRCGDTTEAKMPLFPTFIAVEVFGFMASFVTITLSEARQRSSRKTILLLLQSISHEGNVAKYSAFNADLHLDSLHSFSLLPLPCELPWSFRVYAACYSSMETQICLEEPFMHLREWKSRTTQEERFAIVNPNMDPEITFSIEKRNRANMERRIHAAISQMDGSGEVESLKFPSTSSSSLVKAKLCHIATVETSRGILMEPCVQPGNGTLAAVMPRDIAWPLHLLVADACGKTWRSPPIAGSSSLERLACEMSYLEGRRTAEDGNGNPEPKIQGE
ncbi:hypothetical protein MOQ_004489 [Trypanosoma cruzi marinkellei]|uniref:Uncharacterized protein n=1 Tax=Trypanosoma cruzi marinkellei TaxID=85056 RepID=K2N9X6_TRYCR|nr:hypothetical protein MOQ_004489 [Trypanosoma cruzi marinkellei]